ncbi:hypothetical protein FGB62_311g01 [Gracilaria domingensis]|nr:hypothetical protein FGB62_311g01 [Gracilaria domingensis]
MQQGSIARKNGNKKSSDIAIIVLITTVGVMMAMAVKRAKEETENDFQSHIAMMTELTRRGILFSSNSRTSELKKNGPLSKPTVGKHSGGTGKNTVESSGVKFGVWHGNNASTNVHTNAKNAHTTNVTLNPNDHGKVYVSTFCPDGEVPTGCVCSDAIIGTLEISSLADSPPFSCDCAYSGLHKNKSKSFQATFTCQRVRTLKPPNHHRGQPKLPQVGPMDVLEGIIISFPIIRRVKGALGDGFLELTTRGKKVLEI